METGRMEYPMARESKFLRMAAATQVDSKKVWSQGTEYSSGMTARSTKDSSETARCMGRASSQKESSYLKEYSSRTRRSVDANSKQLTAHTTVSSTMVRSQARAASSGKTTQAIGVAWSKACLTGRVQSNSQTVTQSWVTLRTAST